MHEGPFWLDVMFPISNVVLDQHTSGCTSLHFECQDPLLRMAWAKEFGRVFTLVRVRLMLLPPLVRNYFDWRVWRQSNRLEVALDDTLLSRVGASCNKKRRYQLRRQISRGSVQSCEVKEVAEHCAIDSPPR